MVACRKRGLQAYAHPKSLRLHQRTYLPNHKPTVEDWSRQERHGQNTRQLTRHSPANNGHTRSSGSDRQDDP